MKGTMQTKRIQNIKQAAVIAAAALLLAGCGTTAGYKQADKTGEGIARFREDIVTGKQAIDQTVTALGQVQVTADTNPRKAFQAYSKAVDNLDSAAANVRKSAQEMQAQGQAYFANWEKQLAAIQNEQIRTLAVQQRAKLQETFASIKRVAEPLKTQFDPWMSDMKDLQKYLSNDLTIAGVDAAKTLITKTQNEGREVQKSMDALVAELNSVAAAITPATKK